MIAHTSRPTPATDNTVPGKSNLSERYARTSGTATAMQASATAPMTEHTQKMEFHA